MNTELKPCPFCGKQPRMEKDVKSLDRKDYGDLIIHWRLKCTCGRGCTPDRHAYYRVNNEAQLEVTDKFDGRQEVIDMWNSRV